MSGSSAFHSLKAVKKIREVLAELVNMMNQLKINIYSAENDCEKIRRAICSG